MCNLYRIEKNPDAIRRLFADVNIPLAFPRAFRTSGRPKSESPIAPFLLAQALLEQVASAKGKVIAISTRMGSIADNTSGGFIAYRSSKSALNSAWRSLAIDNRGRAVCAVLRPGWVQTRMGGSSAPLEPEQSVACMRRVIDGLGLENSGGFFSYDGSEIPW